MKEDEIRIRDQMDQIRREMDRSEVVSILEMRGYACYDTESTEFLIETLAMDIIIEGI